MKAFALYFLLPPGQQDRHSESVIALANELGRTPSAVGLKLANIKANDPMRTGKGLSHGSRLDSLVWERFEAEGDAFTGNAMKLLMESPSEVAQPRVAIEYLSSDFPVGKDRVVVATARANQSYFRNSLLENYDHRCCVTGIGVDKLLVASHIKPWSEADPITERLSPDNGLLLNALHDRAFDKGLMTIDKDCRIVISRRVPRNSSEEALLWSYDGQQITMPKRFKPRREFIEYHNDVIFQR